MIKSNFYTSIRLPCLNNFVKIKEINNHEYLDILKFIENNSESELVDFFNFLIDKNTNVESKKISNIDKLCILLEMRSISIGNIIEFMIKNVHTKYSLSDINKNIQSLIINNTKKNFSGIDILFDIPNNFIINESDDIIINCISKIEDISLKELHEAEKHKLYNSLPASIYVDIKDFIEYNNSYFDSLQLFDLGSLTEGSDFKLNPFNRSLIEFLKTIYSDNLMHFYELQFNLITKMNVSYEHFMSMTFNEARMYIAMQNAENKKQEEEQKKSQGKSL
jgi:hypothetical protein